MFVEKLLDLALDRDAVIASVLLQLLRTEEPPAVEPSEAPEYVEETPGPLSRSRLEEAREKGQVLVIERMSGTRADEPTGDIRLAYPSEGNQVRVEPPILDARGGERTAVPFSHVRVIGWRGAS